MTKVLTIGYGRQVFQAGNRERARLRACAEAAGELHMVVFSKRAHGHLPLQDGPLFLYPTNARSRIGMVFSAYRCARTILRTGGDLREWVISAQDPFEAGVVGYLLHRRCGVPLQIQEHGDFFGSDWWRTERPLNRIRYRVGRWILRRASCIRTVSARAAGHLRALGISPQRITVVSVAADLAPFLASNAPGPDLRVQFPDADAIVLSVGRLVKEKNLPLLIRAFARATRHYPRAQLVIVGSGPEEAALKKLVDACSLTRQVTFIPWSDAVPALMQRADIFALSSYREGWARVVLEAMAAGLPGVVTDVGCAGEVFKDGVHGCVVPVDSVAAFARALEGLIADPALRAQYGAQARHDVSAYAAAQPAYPDAWLQTFDACRRKGV